ncbi:MAG TPA: Ig-like domain-containing protein [Spirochaetales bacterium]|nr:Ig-like domain-containing protein [Spirochaetales bacterium]HRY54071.1 Ig-like domain-containing protein [Spirochaetia bacterium]
MVRRRVAPAAAALAAALLVLAACSNPIDFNAEVEDKVMTAKDLYLEVVSVTPAKNSVIDPSSPVIIQFDRALDETTITSTIASIIPTGGGTEVDWTWTYNEATSELTLWQAGMEGGSPYTITLGSDRGLAGSDGSTLRDSLSWSFSTMNLPGGTLKINGGAAYTNSTAVTLTITKNSLAFNIRISPNAFAKDDESVSWEGSVPSSLSRTLLSGDGTKSFYYQFATSTGTRSAVYHADIILDTAPPSIPVITTSATSVPTWTSGGNGGAGYYDFQMDSGTLYTNRTNTSYPYVSATGSHTIQVRERDAAGNYSSYASASFTADISPLSGTASVSSGPTLCFPDYAYTINLSFGTYNVKTQQYTWLYTGSIEADEDSAETTIPIYKGVTLERGKTYYWKYNYSYYNIILRRTITVYFGPYSFTMR